MILILTIAFYELSKHLFFYVAQSESSVGRLLRTLTLDGSYNRRLLTNVLHSEEGFNQAGSQENIPLELLKYLKQQNLSPVPFLPGVLSRNDLGMMKKLSDTFSCKTDIPGFQRTVKYRKTTGRDKKRCSRLDIKHTRIFDSNCSILI